MSSFQSVLKRYSAFRRCSPAYLAMEKVLAQSLAYTTNATIRAMVYTLLAVIIPQLANLAKILCSPFAALFTNMGGRLSMPTDHA